MPSKAAALARSSHPGPSLAISLIVVGLGIGVGLDPLRLVLLGCAMLAGQLSVGLSNDWLDAARDSASQRTDKPIAQDRISAAAVRNAAWACATAMIVLEIALGWRAATALTSCVGLAWAYNLGLKRSVVSTLLYILSFGLLPLIATLSLPSPRVASLWALGVAALFGIAGQFANALPDLDADRSNRVLSLPQRIGPTGSRIVTYAALVGASTVEFIGTRELAFPPAVIGLGTSFLAAIFGVFIAVRPSRWHFRVIIAAAIVDVFLLIAAGSRVLA
jgi:4-hydroxybenzoate polyprenyltransferase